MNAREATETFYFFSGYPLSAQNGAILYGGPESLDPVIERTRAFVRRRAPWSLFLEQSVWESQRSRLESLGFRLERSEPLMMRDTSPRPGAPPSAGAHPP